MSTTALKSAVLGTMQSPLEPLLNRPMSGFDPDAWHVMNERDNSLIRDQVLHGYASKDFIYSFEIKGTRVTGISVIGARELASQYGGIKARIMATVEKRGTMFIFRQFQPMSIDTRNIPDLAAEEDFYECIMEVTDIKTGNSLEVRKKELRREQKSAKNGGGWYDRPHYDVIAESKAYRNGVLAILPQNVIGEFEARCLKAGNTSPEKTIDQLRDGIIAHGTKQGLPLDRKAVFSLSYAEIAGLGGASKDPAAFKEAAIALGILIVPEERKEEVNKQTGEIKLAKKDKPSVPENEAPKSSNTESTEVTYAQVASSLNNSKEIDVLDVAADWISEVKDATQQEELRAMYRARREELSK